MDRFLYAGEKTNQISFPLGGLGTGCIGLAGNGRLIDWEIFNRPNKGSVNGFSHFAIKAERGDSLVDARVLHGDLTVPYSGEFATRRKFQSFGFGPRRENLSGMPHFQSVDFRGEYPLAELTFHDNTFPGEVGLRAFNPFIPLNDHDSGIPAAFFEYEITNSTNETLIYTVVGNLRNPLPANNVNSVEQIGDVHLLYLQSDCLNQDDVYHGNLTLATDAGSVEGTQLSWQQYWFRGAWFDSLEVYWRDLMAPGGFDNRLYEANSAGEQNEGLLAVRFSLAPGETRSVRFVISWHFPNCENYWSTETRQAALDGGIPLIWRNYYATQWDDSRDSAEYALTDWDRLYRETKRFKDALFASTLPDVAIEAISANLSTLKTPVVMRLEDGTFYGWEGAHPNEGCCEGSCTHVWNYTQTLPFLFPKLERTMREADFKYNQRSDGGMAFRLQLPLGARISPFRPCADGHFGGVLKTYRDWKICGDTEWLRSLWPAIKKCIEFAWHPENVDRWDPDKTGVLWGRQHHTLDMELFGPNSWLTGFYLGALKAAAEMAEHLGETALAMEWRTIFEQGKAWANEHLFNGEYYHQLIGLTDRSLLSVYGEKDDTLSGGSAKGGSALAAYWNDEHGEIKYQIGEGSEIDQVLAQWHANLYGLGEIFDSDQIRTTHESLFKYNFKQNSRDQYNPCRVYTLNDEGGLIISVWPEGKYKPMIPLPYSQETQNGYEYAAAIQMIQTGLIDEGMAAISAIRDRYDGAKRNPWNEIECGSNYARSMAAYALLNTFAGFTFDMVQDTIGFNPIRPDNGYFRCFWSLDSGWGEFEISPGQVDLQVLSGTLPLRVLKLPFLANQTVLTIKMENETLDFQAVGGDVQFALQIVVGEGQTLGVRHETI
ncbi:hypothetical protein KFU94_08365 [Chloroflexi bacterium TSY]|nr:hypothetical protein [Chloroflexi bacterium TSY]